MTTKLTSHLAPAPWGTRRTAAHRLWLAAALVAASGSSSALAWSPLHPEAACTGGAARISGSPTVVIHTSEMEGFDFGETLQLVDAMADVHRVLSDVADISIDITSMSLSTTAFSHKSWYGDATPTIHVGFSNTVAAPGQGDGHAIAGACTYDEAHITFWNDSIYPWALLEPEGEGVPYWDAGKSLGGDHSFRLAYLHELLHALGLAHSDDSYSVMNKDERPWHNRSSGEKFQPLPDDVEALRDIYPASNGDSLQLALLNTWYDPDDTSGDGARQKMLCKPSTGDGWADRWDSSRLLSGAAPDDGLDTCGLATGDGDEVCPGDTLWTRVAVANYHTSSVDVALRLWFSLDDTWGGVAGGDVKAAEVREFTLSGQSSSQQGRNFTVPQLPEGEYYVIEKGVATESGGDKTDAWIPLRGKIRVRPSSECPRQLPSFEARPICLFPPCGPDIEIEELPGPIVL